MFSLLVGNVEGGSESQASEMHIWHGWGERPHPIEATRFYSSESRGALLFCVFAVASMVNSAVTTAHARMAFCILRGPYLHGASMQQVLDAGTSRPTLNRLATASMNDVALSMRATMADGAATDWIMLSLGSTLPKLCDECPHYRSALLQAVQSTGVVMVCSSAPHAAHACVCCFNSAVTTAADLQQLPRHCMSFANA